MQTGRAAEAVYDLLDAAVEVGADLVHLVDEHDARHVVLVGLAPDGLGLRLDALVAVEHATAPSSTRSERSTSMVKSTWPGVSMMLRRLPFQKVVVAADVIVMPRSCSCSIQSIVAAPSCTSPILWRLAGVIEDALGRRRLAGIDVGHDAEVAIVLDRMYARHGIVLVQSDGRRRYQR